MGHNGRGAYTLAQSLAGARRERQGQSTWQGFTLKPKDRLKVVSRVLQDVRLKLITARVKEELNLKQKRKDQPEDQLVSLG